MSASRSIAGGLLALVCSLFWLNLLAAQGPLERLAEREEWKGARKVWEAMSDHAAGRTWNRHDFALLRADLDQAKQGLGKLAQEKLLPSQAADELKDFFQARYEWLGESRYPTSATVILSDLNQVRAGAFARFEIFLSAWQEAIGASRRQARLAEQARQGLVQQIELLRRARALRDKIAQEEKDLRAAEGKDEKVEWTRPRLRWARQTFDLVQVFQSGRRVRVSAETERLSELLLALSANPQ